MLSLESKLPLPKIHMDISQGAAAIRTAIASALDKKTGLLVGRNGTIELETLLIRTMNPVQDYPSHIQRRIELHAGVWPPTHTSLDKWVDATLTAIRSCDVLVAGWYKPLEALEASLLTKLQSTAPRIPLRSLESYYVPPEDRWTQLLAGQRVAVVSSFAESISKQLAKREELWPLATDSLLPSTTEWIPIRTGYAPTLAQGVAEWPSGILKWQDAVASIVQQVVDSKARMVLIGCGGLGMVIGAELKKKGIIAIVLGGATQVLFGIKGMRWQTHPVISNLWNDAWAWPLASETPRGSLQIEGACYWNKIEAVEV
jgi:hypothetical protein